MFVPAPRGEGYANPLGGFGDKGLQRKDLAQNQEAREGVRTRMLGIRSRDCDFWPCSKIR